MLFVSVTGTKVHECVSFKDKGKLCKYVSIMRTRAEYQNVNISKFTNSDLATRKKLK